MSHSIDIAKAIKSRFSLNSGIIALRNRTTLNISVVLIGSVLSTGVAFLTTTFLVHRMSADEFGLYRLLIDTATVLFPLLLVGLQYTWNISIVSTPHIEEQSQQKAAILLLTGGLVVLTVLFSRFIITPVSKIVDIGNYEAFIPFAFIICVPLFRDMTEGVLVSQGKLIASAISVLLPQVLILGFILILSAPLRVSSVTILVSAVTVISSFIILYLTRISFRKIKSTTVAILHSNKRVGLPIYLAGIVAVIARNVIQIYTGVRLESVEYGHLSLAIMIAGLLGLIPTAINKAKFKDFANAMAISKKIFVGSIVTIIISAFILYIMSYGYVYFILGTDYASLLKFVPVLLIATFFRGIGDLINRFFFAKGNASILTSISLKIGGINLVTGVPLIFFFGIWGVVIVRLLESFLFLLLNSLEYSRLKNKNIPIA